MGSEKNSSEERWAPRKNLAEERKSPRRGKLPGEESSQERKAPRREKLPGEKSFQERKASRREASRRSKLRVEMDCAKNRSEKRRSPSSAGFLGGKGSVERMALRRKAPRRGELPGHLTSLQANLSPISDPLHVAQARIRYNHAGSRLAHACSVTAHVAYSMLTLYLLCNSRSNPEKELCE
jgi:hypothetical protein